MRAFTTSGRSRCRKWPVPSTISISEPSAMKSSGEPMDDSSMQPSRFAAVEVQRRLRCRQQRGCLLVGQLGHLQRGVEGGAVGADGGDHAVGVTDGSFTRATSHAPS